MSHLFRPVPRRNLGPLVSSLGQNNQLCKQQNIDIIYFFFSSLLPSLFTFAKSLSVPFSDPSLPPFQNSFFPLLFISILFPSLSSHPHSIPSRPFRFLPLLSLHFLSFSILSPSFPPPLTPSFLFYLLSPTFSSTCLATKHPTTTLLPILPLFLLCLFPIFLPSYLSSFLPCSP